VLVEAEAEAIGVEAEAVDEITVSTFLEQRHSQGGVKGLKTPLSNQNIDVYFLSFSPTL